MLSTRNSRTSIIRCPQILTLISIQSKSTTFALRSPGQVPVLPSETGSIMTAEHIVPPEAAVKTQESQSRLLTTKSLEILTYLFQCVRRAYEDQSMSFTTEESETRKPKPSPFSHLMTDRGHKLGFSFNKPDHNK